MSIETAPILEKAKEEPPVDEERRLDFADIRTGKLPDYKGVLQEAGIIKPSLSSADITTTIMSFSGRASEAEDHRMRKHDLLIAMDLLEWAKENFPELGKELMGERELRLKAHKYCPNIKFGCQLWWESNEREIEPDWKEIKWTDI
ncbi:MAG: hypothetical protein U1C49_01730 [Candidatus Andersenbacteria bacterium]|nr:hypothetical protein [bacterium]MDZ4225546.1 hypothetical protein [Candidatus Andersenbacteria bacterium]